jgi:hypothetical protein
MSLRAFERMPLILGRAEREEEIVIGPMEDPWRNWFPLVPEWAHSHMRSMLPAVSEESFPVPS